jgi:hypothetical protein
MRNWSLSNESRLSDLSNEFNWAKTFKTYRTFFMTTKVARKMKLYPISIYRRLRGEEI